jgi:hypothetical protein
VGPGAAVCTDIRNENVSKKHLEGSCISLHEHGPINSAPVSTQAVSEGKVVAEGMKVMGMTENRLTTSQICL